MQKNVHRVAHKGGPNEQLHYIQYELICDRVQCRSVPTSFGSGGSPPTILCRTQNRGMAAEEGEAEEGEEYR